MAKDKSLIIPLLLCFTVYGASVALETVSDKQQAKEATILNNQHVQYSDPKVDTDYSSNAQFNPKGMQHVYTITHAFLDLVQRKDVLPASINLTQILNYNNFWSGPQALKEEKLSEVFLSLHDSFKINSFK